LSVLQILLFRLVKELAVPAGQRACCSGPPESFLFWLSRKFSFIAAQKACSSGCSAMLPGLDAQKYVCFGG
jgi:hypothetical protein